MDTSREEVSSLPSKPDAATLLTSPQRDTHKPSDSPRLQHFDLLARHHSSQVSQSNPDLFTNTKARDGSEVYHTNQWADNFKGESLDKGQSPAPAGESNPAAQAHRSRSKKKTPKEGQLKRELHSQAELPPPPAPTSTDDSLQLWADVLTRSRRDSESKEGSDSPTLQRREEHFSQQKRGTTKWLSQDENVIPYGQSSFLPKVQMSGYGSLGGGVFPRPSTAGRRRDENLM
ncbi:uncharacterized protein LOC111239322 [Seriola dumerili]|uniref:uncharacterized protein LOC111239322 n=1 Tax=Seriola dumerili TaxID=41447 RepID=UPI000BBE0F02|nr:uncharacterized protein LOC111239322 [Seriola dumerili]